MKERVLMRPPTPSFIHTDVTPKGVKISWYKPCWGWFLSYLFLLLVSIAAVTAATPWSDGSIWSDNMLWAQALGLAGLAVGSWGSFGSLFNRHSVIINRYQVVRVIRPVKLFDRHVAYDRSLIHKLYIDERRGSFFRDYRVLALMTGGRDEELFITECDVAAWYLQQSLCGALRSMEGEAASVAHHVQDRISQHNKKAETGDTLV